MNKDQNPHLELENNYLTLRIHQANTAEDDEEDEEPLSFFKIWQLVQKQSKFELIPFLIRDAQEL